MARRSVLVFIAILASFVWALKRAEAQATAWLVDSVSDGLYAVDLVLGGATLRASTAFNGLTAPADLCWIEAQSELYTVDFAGGEVGTIDPSSGNFHVVAIAQPATGWQGLAWDESLNRFLLSNQDNRLYALDPLSGLTTVIGTMNANLVAALDVDDQGVLWGIEFFTGRLLQIDTTTANATFVARLQPGGQGLAVDRAAASVYVANSNTLALHRADLSFFIETVYAPFGSSVRVPKGFDISGAACSGSIARGGLGCLDRGNVALRLEAQGAPCRRMQFELLLQSSQSAAYFLVAGVSDQQWLGLGLPFPLDALGASGCSLYVSHDVILGPIAPNASVRITLPAVPTVLATQTYWQALVVDPQLPSSLPLASSDYLNIVVG